VGRRTDDAGYPRAGGWRAKAGSGPKATVMTASFEIERLQFTAPQRRYGLSWQIAAP
jgi:hypothetical protein